MLPMKQSEPDVFHLSVCGGYQSHFAFNPKYVYWDSLYSCNTMPLNPHLPQQCSVKTNANLLSGKKIPHVAARLKAEVNLKVLINLVEPQLGKRWLHTKSQVCINVPVLICHLFYVNNSFTGTQIRDSLSEINNKNRFFKQNI